MSSKLKEYIFNITLTDADTQYSKQLPIGTERWYIEARTSAVVRWAFQTGKVATPTAPYKTLKSGGTYWEENISSGLLLHFASPTAGTVLEMVVHARRTGNQNVAE